jgi:hypothetical protein
MLTDQSNQILSTSQTLQSQVVSASSGSIFLYFAFRDLEGCHGVNSLKGR